MQKLGNLSEFEGLVEKLLCHPKLMRPQDFEFPDGWRIPKPVA
jgi:hypothetical protein